MKVDMMDSSKNNIHTSAKMIRDKRYKYKIGPPHLPLLVQMSEILLASKLAG